jgi:hypothetical protein
MATKAFCPDAKRLADIAPQKARIDPTERSIPPVRITKVIPAEIIAFIEVCLSTFSILGAERNLGFIKDTKTANIKSPIKGLFLIKMELFF